MSNERSRSNERTRASGAILALAVTAMGCAAPSVALSVSATRSVVVDPRPPRILPGLQVPRAARPEGLDVGDRPLQIVPGFASGQLWAFVRTRDDGDGSRLALRAEVRILETSLGMPTRIAVRVESFRRNEDDPDQVSGTVARGAESWRPVITDVESRVPIGSTAIDARKLLGEVGDHFVGLELPIDPVGRDPRPGVLRFLGPELTSDIVLEPRDRWWWQVGVERAHAASLAELACRFRALCGNHGPPEIRLVWNLTAGTPVWIQTRNGVSKGPESFWLLLSE